MHTTAAYTEHELVLLLKAKDERVFTYLYENYGGGLYNIILQIIPDKELACDLLQETFIHIWNKASTYDNSKGRLFTWMLHIARNLAIDMRRSKAYRNNLVTLPAPQQDDDNYYGPAVIVMPEVLNGTGLKKAVQHLKPQHRGLIDLAYFQGYTQAEIACMQGVPLGTVKTRIRNALIHLRELIQ